MKILLAVHAFAPETRGGTERTVEALARAMQADGHELSIVAGALQPAPSEPPEAIDVDGLRVLRLHRSDLYYEHWHKAWSPPLSRAFAALLARERPDVVHVHHWLRLSSDLARLARAAGARVAVTLHDYYAALARPVRLVGEDAAVAPPAYPYMNETERQEAFALHRDDFADELAAAHRIYAPSRAHADGLRALLPGPIAEIAVSRPPLLARPGRSVRPPQRGRRLVTWGAIYPAKGLETAIDALRRVGPEGGVTLDVYGEASDPAHGASLRERAAGLPVRFHGRFTPDQLERCSADFALLPSICHESYGLTLDEAASFGWPVLASDLPSYAERIAPAHGRTFRAGDPGALAALLRDPALDSLVPAAPSTWSAADAARQLLDDYAAIRPGGAPPPPRVDATRRLLHLWRRAEWRLHVVLYHPSPYAPPDDVGA